MAQLEKAEKSWGEKNVRGMVLSGKLQSLVSKMLCLENMQLCVSGLGLMAMVKLVPDMIVTF